MKKKEPLKVIYRKFKKSGDIIAFFPTECGNGDPATCSSYMHIGQHGSADYAYLLRQTTLATKAEYGDLHNELKQIYSDCFLIPVKKATYNDYKQRSAAI